MIILLGLFLILMVLYIAMNIYGYWIAILFTIFVIFLMHIAFKKGEKENERK